MKLYVINEIGKPQCEPYNGNQLEDALHDIEANGMEITRMRYDSPEHITIVIKVKEV